MRSTWKTWIAIVAGLAFAPAALAASDVDEQLRLMNERLNEMEDRLQATTDELEGAQRIVDEQQTVIEEAGLDSGSKSGLSSFIESTDFSGWVASSYTINVRAKGKNKGLSGQNGAYQPFHDDSNAFKLNQVWFVMDKDVDEESRGGFHIDLLFGQDADVQSPAFTSNRNTGDNVEVHQAYVSWLAPLPGPGLRMDAGKFQTLVGAEVVQSPHNFNITRSMMWGQQPVTHVGMMTSVNFDMGFGAAFGIVNDGFSDDMFDNNHFKTVTGALSYTHEMFSVSASAIFGSENRDLEGNDTSSNRPKRGMVGLLVTFDPTDRISMWIDGNWGWRKDPTVSSLTNDPLRDQQYAGVGMAGRVAVLDSTGVALRVEYLYGGNGYLNNLTDPDQERQSFESANQRGSRTDLLGLTGTVDHNLTENLMFRLEGRYDVALKNTRDPANNKRIFRNANGRFREKSQVTAMAEVVYNF